jgi:hypothetical protein
VKSLIFLFCFLSYSAYAQDEKCSVIHEDSKGELQNTMVPTLKVIELTNTEKEFKLPQLNLNKITSVMCGRITILPLENDYKVPLAGYVFYITDSERVLVIEISNGKLQLRMVSGEFTEKEIPIIQEFANQVSAKL